MLMFGMSSWPKGTKGGFLLLLYLQSPGGNCKIGLHVSQVGLKIILHVICNYEWR